MNEWLNIINITNIVNGLSYLSRRLGLSLPHAPMKSGHMTMRLLKSMSLSEAALARTVTLLSNRPDDTSRNVDEEQNDVMP